MKCIRAFADNMQAHIILYIIYQSSPITNRSVIGMLSSVAWNPFLFCFLKVEGEEGNVPVAKNSGRFCSMWTIYVLLYFSPVIINVLVWIKLGEGGKITRNKICFRISSGMYFLIPNFHRAGRCFLCISHCLGCPIGMVLCLYSKNTWLGCVALRVSHRQLVVSHFEVRGFFLQLC